MYLIFSTCAKALAVVIAINIFIMVVKIYTNLSKIGVAALSAGFEKKKVMVSQFFLVLITVIYNLILILVLYLSFIWLD